MGESIAQSFSVNDSKRRDEIGFDGAIAIVDHIFVPLSFSASYNKPIRGMTLKSRPLAVAPNPARLCRGHGWKWVHGESQS
jgi:hypothetical protein